MPTSRLSSNPIRRQTLAEQMAKRIKEMILSGELSAGDPLPTEPELATNFEVSRAVVRDATRILMALGLVDVQHGRGVFVTQPQNEVFGEAFILALQRAKATAWDVEQFEQMLLPEVAALAATSATEEDLAVIQKLGDQLIDDFSRATFQAMEHGGNMLKSDVEIVREDFRVFYQSIILATKNQVLIQLASPLLNLRNLRNWMSLESETPKTVIAKETKFINLLLEAIQSKDASYARNVVSELVHLPPQAIQAMKNTPIGEIPQIPLSFTFGWEGLE